MMMFSFIHLFSRTHDTSLRCFSESFTGSPLDPPTISQHFTIYGVNPQTCSTLPQQQEMSFKDDSQVEDFFQQQNGCIFLAEGGGDEWRWSVVCVPMPTLTYLRLNFPSLSNPLLSTISSP